MKAFIAYSLNQQEQYIATLLSYKLREQGFSLILSNNIINITDPATRNQIISSQLFVGLISVGGGQWQRVLDEYMIASKSNVPAVLLIEDKVPVFPWFTGNYVHFNRANPHQAIEEIKMKMLKQPPAQDETLGWILGGAALLALIALLTNNDRK